MFSIVTPRSPRRMTLAGAWALAFMILTVPGQAQSPPAARAKTAPKPSDPRAKALVEEVARAYRALASYGDEGQFTMALTVAGQAQKQTIPMKVTFVRPNKLEVETGPVRLVSDGKTMTTVIAPLKRYTSGPAPEKLDLETFRQGPLGAALFGGPAGAPMFVLLSMLTSADPIAAFSLLDGSLQIAPGDAKGAQPGGAALLVDQEQGPDLRLEIDPASKLFTRIELQIDPEVLARSAQAGKPIVVERFGWTSGAVQTSIPADRSFALEIPKDFSKVESLLEGAGGKGEAPRFAIDEKVGKPAPDFTLTLLDGPNKTRTVKKSELAGKVVVIDFWATWCGPCLQELPEIQKLTQALAQDKKNVMVIALSQDSEPSELGEVRKLVEKTLKDKQISLTDNAVGAVGLDPSNSVGQAFTVEGYPTVVILDAKGVVQAAHVGYSPEIREKLAADINTLLAGKSLARDEAKPAAAGKPNAK